jgi:hypothetical protein
MAAGMILPGMQRTVRTGERQAYTSAVVDLWKDLGVALVRLEKIAESPEQRSDLVLDELPALQYSLHAGAELAHGIRAPAGLEAAHAELVASLAQARDATAEIAVAVEAAGPELVDPLLPEWRGALFRVRLARLRALERPGLALAADDLLKPAEPEHVPFNRTGLAALVATVLVLGGGLLFTAGAVLAAWPIWAAGLMLATGGFLLVRP